MPKAKNRACSRCVGSMQSRQHKCVRHSSLCINPITGLYDPTNCVQCQDLYERVNADDDLAKNMLREMAYKIAAKIKEKGTVAPSIFASEALRLQYDVKGFFRKSITFRGPSGDRSRSSSYSSELSQGPAPVPVDPVLPDIQAPNPVEAFLREISASPDEVASRPVSAAASLFSGFEDQSVNIVVQPDVNACPVGVSGYGGSSQDPSTPPSGQGGGSDSYMPQQHWPSVDLNSQLSQSNVLQAATAQETPFNAPSTSAGGPVVQAANAPAASNDEVLSSLKNISTLFMDFMAQQKNQPLVTPQAAPAAPAPATHAPVAPAPIAPAPVAPAPVAPVPRAPLRQSESDVSSDDDGEAEEDNLDFQFNDQNNDPNDHDAEENNVPNDHDSEDDEEQPIRHWPGFHKMTYVSPRLSRTLNEMDPPPTRYRLRQDHLNLIDEEGWWTKKGLLSWEDVYIAANEQLEAFVVPLRRSHAVFEAVAALDHFDLAQKAKSPSDLKKCVRVVRNLSNWAPAIPQMWTANEEEKSICMNGFQDTVSELFGLDKNFKPQKLACRLSVDSEEAQKCLDFVQGEELREDCNQLENVFQSGLTKALSAAQRKSDFSLRSQAKRELFALGGLELLQRILWDAVNRTPEEAHETIVALDPFVESLLAAFRSSAADSVIRAKEFRSQLRIFATKDILDGQVKNALNPKVVSNAASLFEAEADPKVVKLLESSEQRKVRVGKSGPKRKSDSPGAASFKIPRLQCDAKPSYAARGGSSQSFRGQRSYVPSFRDMFPNRGRGKPFRGSSGFRGSRGAPSGNYTHSSYPMPSTSRGAFAGGRPSYPSRQSERPFVMRQGTEASRGSGRGGRGASGPYRGRGSRGH